MVALDGRLLDRAVHALDLTIGPRTLDLGLLIFDPVFLVSNKRRDVFGFEWPILGLSFCKLLRSSVSFR